MSRRLVAALPLITAWLLAACGTTSAPEPPRAALDHVMIGVADLDAAIRDFARATGVTPMRGGRHPERGTENALVSLGSGVYLELIAPDREQHVDDPFVHFLAGLQKPVPVGWALRVTNAASAHEYLRTRGIATTEPRAGSRVTSSGETLAWTTFDLNGPETEAAPFFIEWKPGTRHPSLSAPSGCVLERFELADPAAKPLDELLRAMGVPMHVESAAHTQMRVGLVCGGKRATFSKS